MQPQDIRTTDEVEAIEFVTYEAGELPRDNLHEIAELRFRVWKPILDKSSFSRFRQVSDWIDPVDKEAVHFIIMDIEDPSKIAAAARLSIHDSILDLHEPYILRTFPNLKCESPIAKFGHLVVDPHDRHHGFGYRLDTLRYSEARIRGAKTAVMLVVPWRVANYERLGCDMVGPIAPVEHGYFDQTLYLMTKSLDWIQGQ